MKNKTLKIIYALLMLNMFSASQSFAIYRKPPQLTPYYHYLMARIYINMGEIKEAIMSLERASRYGPPSWSVNWDLLELYYITGLYYKARNVAAKMYGEKPDDPKLLELMADIYANTNEYKKSVETYNKLLELKPKSNLARFNLASLHEKQGNYKDAVTEYSIVLKNDRENLYARLALADAYLELEKYDAAIKNYKESVKYGAEPKDINLQLAKIYNLKKKYKKAISYLEDNIEMYPDDQQSYFLMVEILRKTGDDKEAEKILVDLKGRSDNKLNVLLHLGTMYSDMEEIEKALDVFKELTELYPAEFTGWYLLGLTYEYLERFDEALVAYGKASGIKEDPQLYFHMAIIYDRKGDVGNTDKYLSKCLSLDPDHAAANNYIGYSYAEQGVNLEEAEDHVLKALNAEPDNEAFLDSLGWVYYKQHRYEEAITQLEKASIETKDPLILEHLGDAYAKKGRKEEAIEIYNKALSLDPDNNTIKRKIEELSK